MQAEALGLKTLAGVITGGGGGGPCPSNLVDRSPVASPSPSEDNVGETSEEEEEEEDNSCWASYGRRSPGRRFPPPIPLLARTGNLPCHMPWVLKRTYKADGSLVIQEVRVKHHEYFRARRENGRLTLRLVHLDESSPLYSSGPRCPDEQEKETTSSSCSLKITQRMEGTKEVDFPIERSRCDMSSFMMLSSSMPEPAFAAGMRSRCFTDGGSRPMQLVPMSRQRAG